METAYRFFQDLNQRYSQVHRAKEELFWANYMAVSHDQEAFTRAEQEYLSFISNPQLLAQTRAHLAAIGNKDAQLTHGLRGWEALFAANIIENDEAKSVMREMLACEATLFAANRDLRLSHINERGESEHASLSALATNLMYNPVEERRKSSFEALRSKEEWLLQNGFLELVVLRNRFARAQGHADFFAYKCQQNARMTQENLFAILDDFEIRTRSANLRTLEDLKSRFGPTALAPWNIRYHQQGDAGRALDAYLPFGKALQRWVESFRRLGISFRGARLQLDLFERENKFQNGFCHSPHPPYFKDGQWLPAEINFTSLANPAQTGSGLRGLITLFHEGGHAAHMANITQNAPCFAQEFAPTTMAYAETQSMFCDSLLDDPEWLKTYALNAQGEAPPDDLLRALVEQNHPLKVFQERSTALVSYFESALYKLDYDRLNPEQVMRLARATETTVLGISASPRPVLAIPHLLSNDWAASYHGYLLAEMAVEQTRAFFLQRDGYLCDNPAIGPALTEHYWQPGNSISHDAGLRSLTGKGFSARYLADNCNLSSAQVWQQAQQALQARAQHSADRRSLPHLDAQIRIVHGAELIADNSESEQQMCADFEEWVKRHYSTPA